MSAHISIQFFAVRIVCAWTPFFCKIYFKVNLTTPLPSWLKPRMWKAGCVLSAMPPTWFHINRLWPNLMKANLISNFHHSCFYWAFHGFGQAKFAYGSLHLCSSQFTLLPQPPLKPHLIWKGSKLTKKSCLINLNPWHTLQFGNLFEWSL